MSGRGLAAILWRNTLEISPQNEGYLKQLCGEIPRNFSDRIENKVLEIKFQQASKLVHDTLGGRYSGRLEMGVRGA